MEFLALFGSVALAAFLVAARRRRGERPDQGESAPTAARTWTAASSPSPERAHPWSVSRLREEEAFVDGAVIGYHLARDHHQRQAARAVEDAARQGEVAPAAGTDGATFDVVGAVDAFEDADAFEAFGWEVDGFGEAADEDEEAEDAAFGVGADLGFDDPWDDEHDW